MTGAIELQGAREQSDSLFSLVHPDSLYERSIPERHRIIFYLGHLEAFDWNLVARYALELPAFHPEFDRLFAFGIAPPAGQLPQDKPEDWPGIAEVERYNQRTRDEIDRVWHMVPEQLRHVAIEHRLMHAETFAYILHGLDYAQKAPMGSSLEGAARVERPHAAAASSFVRIPEGVARLGRSAQDGFGWDNEFESVSVRVPEFSISRYKVTNGDYLEFVRQGAAPPFFWTDRDGRWFYRGMFAEIPLPLEWPVYVTLREAAAYAAWRGMRLPSEAEWHRAACASPLSPSANFDFRRWDPAPVTADDDGIDGPMQMSSNGWEWTSTVFAPFPGFQPFPFYRNYSEPFFDGEHYVLKGASPRTAASLTRPSFRNWFRPAYPYIYATFRLIES